MNKFEYKLLNLKLYLQNMRIKQQTKYIYKKKKKAKSTAFDYLFIGTCFYKYQRVNK